MIELGQKILLGLRYNLITSKNIVVVTDSPAKKVGITTFLQQALRGAGHTNSLEDGAICFQTNDLERFIIPFCNDDEYFPPLNSTIFSL